MKVDWKSKLASRKFWCAAAGFVTAILTALNVPGLRIEQVVAVIGALGVLAAYIFAQSKVDASRELSHQVIESYYTKASEDAL